MSDPRLAWLVSGPLSGLLASSGGGGAAAVGGDPSVQAWLSTPSVRLLSAYTLVDGNGSGGVRFTNEIGALAQSQVKVDAEVHLIKLDNASKEGADQQTPADFAKSVLVTNTVGDAVQGLYQLIHSVFAPKLLGYVCSA